MLNTIFATNIFLSAFLVFLVQPMLAKSMLPHFGGSAFVWIASLLFFQFGLLIGYIYAHYLCKISKIAYQAGIHFFVIVLSLLFLPLELANPSWNLTWGPSLNVLMILFLSVFVPFAALSASSPLLQYWFCHIKKIKFPYYFYAISNAGSLIGLLCYPFLVEYYLNLSTQKVIWSLLFLGFIVLSIICLFYFYHSNKKQNLEKSLSHPKPTKRQISLWLLYSFISCGFLLSLTQYLSQNILNLPLLWVMPLALYLISFIVTFKKAKQYNFKLWGTSWLFWCGLLMALFLFVPAKGTDFVFVTLALFFSGCMVCHGELVDLAPKWEFLTDFYLVIALGGVLGGIFVNFISVWLFNDWWDYYISILVITFIVYLRYAVRLTAQEKEQSNAFLRYSLLLLFLYIIAVLYITYYKNLNSLERIRNFYGVIQVKEQVQVTKGLTRRKLFHGRVLHGLEVLGTDTVLKATTYYSPKTPIGRVIEFLQKEHDALSIGVIGLGIGTLTAYARPTDHLTFFEIDSDIINIAKAHFSFISKNQGTSNIILQDGLLALEQHLKKDSPFNFDLLVVDAFSGDSIPFHLLTQEAVDLYQKHLKKGGVIAFHISNMFIDFQPLIQGLAKHLECETLTLFNRDDPTSLTQGSDWGIISCRSDLMTWLEQNPKNILIKKPTSENILWTDEQNSILPLIKPIKLI